MGVGVTTIDFRTTDGCSTGAGWKVFLTGGSRTERKRWSLCIEAVDVLLYVVRLDEYDLMLLEDEKTNRTVEALNLFGKLCGMSWFEHSVIHVLFTHYDLFVTKLAKVRLW